MEQDERILTRIFFALVVAIVVLSLNLALLWTIHRDQQGYAAMDARMERLEADVDMATALAYAANGIKPPPTDEGE